MANKYIPLNFSLSKRKCLIVGGGEVALRKVENLLGYECDITLIAPEPLEKFEYFSSKKKINLLKRKYESSESKNYGMVIAASDDDEVNKTVHDDCSKFGVPVNVVDNPDLCDFTFPAVLQRGNLTVSISTDGKAPFLASRLRMILEDIFPTRWQRIAAHAASFRDMVRDKWKDDSLKKAKCFNLFLQADWKTILKEKSEAEISAELGKMLGGRQSFKED
jgi:siroheme synthase-like protein